jgi:hypothetical protein
MIAVPADIPVTVPVEEPTVAMPVAPLLHVPPVGVPLKVEVPPTHITNVPDIVGTGFTVTVAVE